MTVPSFLSLSLFISASSPLLSSSLPAPPLLLHPPPGSLPCRLSVRGHESSRYLRELWHGLPHPVPSLHGRQLERHYEGTRGPAPSPPHRAPIRTTLGIPRHDMGEKKTHKLWPQYRYNVYEIIINLSFRYINLPPRNFNLFPLICSHKILICPS